MARGNSLAAVSLGALAALAACTKEQSLRFDATAIRSEGGARYSTELLEGEKGPSNHDGSPAIPKVTSDFRGKPPTNDWWSSLIWAFDGDAYSRAMFPHPLAVRAVADGLGVGYPSEAKIEGRSYRFPYAEDLRVSTTGLRAPDARVKSSSDWTVTAAWSDAEHPLETTIGHGLPFVYARTGEKKDARVVLGEGATTWGAHGEVLGVTVHGHDYGLFAPTGSTWKVDGGAAVSDLAGKGFFSVAVLPDHAPETLELFRRHAYAFVTGTRVSWKYEPRDAKVTSHFEVTTSLVEPGADRVDEPLLALYPHQWKASHATLTPFTYASPRGTMKLLAGRAFDVERAFHGVLPALPVVEQGKSQLEGFLHDEASGGDLFPQGLDGKKDTYWAGKSLGRVSTLAWIAHDLGDEDTVAKLTKALTRELDDWFDGEPPERFYYDKTWGTLIGYPAGYQSNTELNDHHFHYGYFVWAAATVAALAPTSGAKERWTPFVKMLIDDVANTSDADERFPRLRSFDPYAGHSWASGAAMFDHGNNEESSSEDQNFSAALTLWGTVTGDAGARDLGAFLYETLTSAIEQYWFDVDHDVFPKSFGRPVAAIVWGDGAAYDTWWSRDAVYVHGINVLPVTGASLYLGRRPEAITAAQAYLETQNHGPPRQWRDVLWEQLALADPAKARAAVEHEHYFDPEFGNSWTSVLSWVDALDAYGIVDPTVLADAPSYAVFKKDRARTYAAYAPGPGPLHVTFTDGATLDVPAGSLRSVTRTVP